MCIFASATWALPIPATILNLSIRLVRYAPLSRLTSVGAMSQAAPPNHQWGSEFIGGRIECECPMQCTLNTKSAELISVPDILKSGDVHLFLR
jgi:hypothetical protein